MASCTVCVADLKRLDGLALVRICGDVVARTASALDPASRERVGSNGAPNRRRVDLGARSAC